MGDLPSISSAASHRGLFAPPRIGSHRAQSVSSSAVRILTSTAITPESAAVIAVPSTAVDIDDAIGARAATMTSFSESEEGLLVGGIVPPLELLKDLKMAVPAGGANAVHMIFLRQYLS